MIAALAEAVGAHYVAPAGAITLAQPAVLFDGAFASGTSAQATINVTAGSMIVVQTGIGQNTTATVTDSKGNTYTNVATFYNASIGAIITMAYAMNVAAGSTVITVTYGASGVFRQIIAEEYKGVALTGALDAHTNGEALLTATTTPTASSITPTVDGCLIKAMINSNGKTATAGTGFTLNGFNASSQGASEYLVQTAKAAVAASFALSAAGQTTMLVAAFKPA